MKTLRLLSLLLMMFVGVNTFAQDSEKDVVIRVCNKIITTAFTGDNSTGEETRKDAAALLTWLADTESYSMTVGKWALRYGENGQLTFAAFMAGETRYALENGVDKTTAAGVIAGDKAAYEFYELNKDKLDVSKKLAKWFEKPESEREAILNKECTSL